MGKLTTTYEVDGRPVAPESVEAWELTRDALLDAQRPLIALPTGLVPEAVRDQYQKVDRALSDLRSLMVGITVQARRYEKHGRSDALATALDDAALAGKIKRS